MNASTSNLPTERTDGTINFIRGQYPEVLTIPAFRFHADMEFDGLTLAARTKYQTVDGHLRSQRAYLFIDLDENGIATGAKLCSTDYGCPELYRWTAEKIAVQN
jgi:hypothetical protein